MAVFVLPRCRTEPGAASSAGLCLSRVRGVRTGCLAANPGRLAQDRSHGGMGDLGVDRLSLLSDPLRDRSAAASGAQAEFFNVDKAKWIDNALKSISFFGINEAIITHCGIEIDRIEKSESFALEVIEFMNNIIKEKNHEQAESFILTQPHRINDKQDSLNLN